MSSPHVEQDAASMVEVASMVDAIEDCVMEVEAVGELASFEQYNETGNFVLTQLASRKADPDAGVLL